MRPMDTATAAVRTAAAVAVSAAGDGLGGELRRVLNGEPATLRAGSEGRGGLRLWHHLGLIVVGAGCYGATVGWWRAPEQGLLVAVKFPLLLLLTALGNALLNAMLAPLLGLHLAPRQSFVAILMSFSVAAVLLGAISPLAAFLVWNAPPLAADPSASRLPYEAIQLFHVAVIALAGVAANVRLAQLLRELSGDAGVARRVLLAWLAGNLLLGSQLSWVFRPFIGAPDLPVEFLREQALRGSFYETVFHAALRFFSLS